jgi:hypothetical protein
MELPTADQSFCQEKLEKLDTVEGRGGETFQQHPQPDEAKGTGKGSRGTAEVRANCHFAPGGSISCKHIHILQEERSLLRRTYPRQRSSLRVCHKGVMACTVVCNSMPVSSCLICLLLDYQPHVAGELVCPVHRCVLGL